VSVGVKYLEKINIKVSADCFDIVVSQQGEFWHL